MKPSQKIINTRCHVITYFVILVLLNRWKLSLHVRRQGEKAPKLRVRALCAFPMCRIPMENKKAKYELNKFYHVFVKVSKLHFQGKLVSIDKWNNDGFRYTFREISNSSRPMANVYWSFNDMACITQL